MTRACLALLAALPLLAACGVDGPPSPPPEPPKDERRDPGISIGGSIGVGVAGSSVRRGS